MGLEVLGPPLAGLGPPNDEGDDGDDQEESTDADKDPNPKSESSVERLREGIGNGRGG